MDNQASKFKSIPSHACILSVGEFEVGDNGESAKTAPVSLVARSGKPIEHWFWGKVVHDLSGMTINKTRLAIDYCHDDKEVIGYLNKFDSSSGDLVTSGALVPFKDSDRATEIIHKMKMGVPYEASINFGGDGIVVEEVPEGVTVEVNGYQLTGEAVIVRSWPLRGVAICPYGADANTESTAFTSSNKTFSATVASAIVPEVQPPTEETTQMSEASVEVVADKGTEAEKATELEAVKPEEVKAEAQAVEAVAVETVVEEEVEAVESSSDDLDKVKALIDELQKAKEEAQKALAEKEAVKELTAKRQELENEVAELKRKLSAYDNGETVLTAKPTPETKLNNNGTWFDKARANGKV
jgi:hypothetical protein